MQTKFLDYYGYKGRNSVIINNHLNNYKLRQIRLSRFRSIPAFTPDLMIIKRENL
jgi:hypothetical protein